MSFNPENPAGSMAPADDGALSAQIHAWLSGLAQPAVDPATLRAGPAVGPAPDAFMPHFRVDASAGQAATYLVVATGERTAQYERATDLFAESGLAVPPVLAAGPRAVLTEDLGALTYALQLSLDSAHQLHMDAMGALLALQGPSQADVLPVFGRAQMAAELALFTDWFLGRHLGITPTAAQRAQLDKVFETLLASACGQGQVYIHRNFQPRNLLVLPGTPGVLGLGGAAYGPVTYDLVSLLRDTANAWDEEMVLDWAVRYWQAARQGGIPVAADIDQFYRDFELMGVQRHLMLLGLYARMAHEGGDRGHLVETDQLLEYVRKAGSRYNELKPLVRLLDEWENRQPQVGYTF